MRSAFVTQVIKQYFNPESEQKLGSIRFSSAGFQTPAIQQKKKYFKIIGGVLLIAVFFAVYSYMQHQEIKKQKALAAQIFYDMKAMELELSRLQEKAEANQIWRH